MTKEERIIATAYTGISFISGSEMGEFYEYAAKKIGHGVLDLTLTNRGFWIKLQDACKDDFLSMIHASTEETKKPPLGVVPRFIWDKWRMKELKAAIARFEEAHYPVPEEFIKELQDLKEKEEE